MTVLLQTPIELRAQDLPRLVNVIEPPGLVEPVKGRLLALTGKAGAGKSTIASAVLRQINERRGAAGTCVVLRFAGPIKAALRAMGLSEREVDGDLKEIPCALLGGKTPRQAMQSLGDWGRALDVDLWVRLAFNEATKWLDIGRDVVIDDCRFANEAQAVWEHGGVVIELLGRGGHLGTSHASEVGVPDRWIHEVVANIGTVDEVACAVESAWNAALTSNTRW